MPKICIVLATYNGEKYLSQMLDSLLSQTRKADLIIAVDDGSRDASLQILKEYENRLPLQITALKQNSGHRAAFSKCLEIARPMLNDEDFIALADQDDIWLPHKLEILENAFNANDSIGNDWNKQSNVGKSPDLVFGDAEVIDDKGNITSNSWRTSEGILKHLDVKTLLTGFTNVTGCLMMFRASLLSSVMPIPEGIPVHDQWITLMAALQNGYCAIDDAVIQYRIHGGNAIGQSSSHTWKNKLETNLRWAKAVSHSQAIGFLDQSSKEFLDKFIEYLEARFKSNFVFGKFPWLLKNSKFINPHVHGIPGHLNHSLFGTVGIDFATRFLGKK